MLILIKSDQLGLFETTTIVKPHVRKDGVLVDAHPRRVKRKQEPIKAVVKKKPDDHGTLDLFASDHEPITADLFDHQSAAPVAESLPADQADDVEGQKSRLKAALNDLADRAFAAGDGKLSGSISAFTMNWNPKDLTAEEVNDIIASKEKLVVKAEKAKSRAGQRNESLRSRTTSDELPIVEHQTKKRLLRGVVSTNLTKDQAQAIDPYTFKKDGGWFIREKYLLGGQLPDSPQSITESIAEDAQLNAGESKPDQETGAGRGIDYNGAFDPEAISQFGVQPGVTESERRRRNANAVDIVNTKPIEDISDDERTILSSYSGTGGIGDSLNEFYTDARVAAAIWKSMFDMGLPANSRVLEPSCGTGVFMHTAPFGVKVVGVELDDNSSKIARVLHGHTHEVHNASLERFATQDDRQFDAVIGNPPFGLRGSLIKDDKPDLSNAESYFIDTSLDKCRPNGIVALIVPTGVMDSKSGRAFRERMLRKAQFLGAMRMPNTAFDHAHTKVTTDVIYLRKRADDVAGALMTVDQDTLRKVGVWDDDFLAGKYFTDGEGSSKILGTMTEGWRAKAGMGQDITVEGSMIGVPEAIAAFQPSGVPQGNPAISDIMDALGDDEKAKQKALGAATRKPYSIGKSGDTKVVDGVTYILQGSPLRWHKVEDLMAHDEVMDAAPIAETIEALMSGKQVDHDALVEAINDFVAKHGNPAKSKALQAAAGHDKTLYRLIGAVKPDGSLSDAVTGKMAKKLEGGFDVVAHTMASRQGKFSVDELAESLGKDADEVLDHLYASGLYAYLPGTGEWTTSDEYLSGELWPKFDEAKAAMNTADLDAGLLAKLRTQVEQLDAAIDPASLDDVFVEVNNAWIPLDVVSDFFTQKNANGNRWVQDLPPVEITFEDGIYTVKGGNQHGESKLLSTYLNRTGVRKDDRPAIESMNTSFKEWLCSSEHRERVEELYNRKFKGFKEKTYSDEPFEIPGLQSDGLKQYQYAGLRWDLETGRGIIAADVGLGKTARGLILSRMAKINGQAKKPVIVVPKSVLANWVAEANKWFPGSKVLTIGGEFAIEDGKVVGHDDSAADRNRKYHDLTQNEYDFIFISQPAFNELDMSPERKNNYLNDDFWVQRGDKLGNAGDKRIKKVREQFEQSAASREFQDRTDAINFDDLGIDMLMVDEGHAYKNLYAAKSRFGDQPKFLGGQGQSNRSFDMAFKAKFVRENASNGGNVYLLTATPTKNSPLEIYSMLSFIAPEAFERIGIRNSEEFIDRFCSFEAQDILNTTGEIENALVTVGFKNMNELREIMRKYINRKTAEDVGLVIPKADPITHLVDMDAAQKRVYEDLREKASEASSSDATGDAHIFSIMDKMNKASIDLSLLSDGPKNHKSPKIVEAVKNIVQGMDDGGQVVFSDYVDTHDKLVEMLVAAGVKKNQIGVINAKAAGSSAKRQRISDDFNAGKLKVVIGNTATMGEGINLQKNTADIHHLDIPWEPASVQQRNGRGRRQGNAKDSIRIHTYMSKGSFDGYRWMTVSAKRDWQDLLWNGGDKIENYSKEGDLSREEMMVMLSANPDAERKKMAASKEAAVERFNADQRRAAAEQFAKLRYMQNSYRGMKSKNGEAAARLSQKITKAKDLLFSNKHFLHKELLDSSEKALIHPDSGAAIMPGSLITPAPGSPYKNKMVVTGIEPDGTFKVRNYASSNAGSYTVELKDIGSNDQVGKNDEKAEAAEIAEQLKSGLTREGGIESVKELVGIPEKAVEESYEPIQSRMKSLAASYKDKTSHGNVLVINDAGHVTAEESYAYRDKVNSPGHDFVLPIARHREAVLDAWVKAERDKNFKVSWDYSRKGGSKQVFKTEYPGKYGQDTNPLTRPAADLFGESFVEEAKRRLQNEIATKARHATSFSETAEAVKPMVTVEYGRVVWPKRALAVLFAKAKKDDALDERGVDTFKVSEYGSPWKHLLNFRGGNGAELNTADTLIGEASSQGYKDLAAAMALDAHASNPAHALEVLGSLASTKTETGAFRPKTEVSYHKTVLDAMRHLVEKNPDIGNAKVSEYSSELKADSSWYRNKVFKNTDLTIRQALKEASEHGND